MWRLQFLHFIWFSLAVILLPAACAWPAPDPSAFFSSPVFAQSLASAIDAFEEATSFLSEEPSGPRENQSKHKLMLLHMVAFLGGRPRGDEDHLQHTQIVPVVPVRRFVPRKLLPSTAPDDPPFLISSTTLVLTPSSESRKCLRRI